MFEMTRDDPVTIDETHQEKLNAALRDAVKADDPQEIIRLVRKKGAEVDAVFGEEGQTLLSLAIINDKKKAINALLNLGADPNIPDEEGWTAFHHAAAHCNVDQLNHLLDKGAKIDKPTNDMQTAMHIAALEQGPDIIMALIARGAKISPIDRFGDNPIELARQNEKSENVEALSQAKSLRSSQKIMQLRRQIKKRRPKP